MSRPLPPQPQAPELKQGWQDESTGVTGSLRPWAVCSVVSNPKDCSPPGSSVHGDSPGKKTGVGCHAFLQGICAHKCVLLKLLVF